MGKHSLGLRFPLKNSCWLVLPGLRFLEGFGIFSWFVLFLLSMIFCCRWFVIHFIFISGWILIIAAIFLQFLKKFFADVKTVANGKKNFIKKNLKFLKIKIKIKKSKKTIKKLKIKKKFFLIIVFIITAAALNLHCTNHKLGMKKYEFLERVLWNLE